MTPNETPTPLTDAAAMDGCYNLNGSRIYLQAWDYRKTLDGEVVPIEFARAIERRNAELVAALERIIRDAKQPPSMVVVPAWRIAQQALAAQEGGEG